ncbi:MAG TPA: TIR domain-containing protein, partial [Actinomycetota bacterium]|nr:TIR domain-containing protein [Actinomycetota bacterium]
MTEAASGPGVRIFINYRRDDTAGHAGRLYDSLVEEFGDGSVFMDIDTIDPGEDFVEVIHEGVGSCDVVLSL